MPTVLARDRRADAHRQRLQRRREVGLERDDPRDLDPLGDRQLVLRDGRTLRDADDLRADLERAEATFDRFVPLDQAAGAIDHRNVDHLAIHRERAAALSRGFFVGLDQSPRVGDFIRRGCEGVVQAGHEAGVDAGAAREAEASRPFGALPSL